LQIKLIGSYFDAIEVIEAESQAVLNHSENTTSIMHFKKMAEALGAVHAQGSDLIRG
jgi:hypothetical protein